MTKSFWQPVIFGAQVIDSFFKLIYKFSEEPITDDLHEILYLSPTLIVSPPFGDVTVMDGLVEIEAEDELTEEAIEDELED